MLMMMTIVCINKIHNLLWVSGDELGRFVTAVMMNVVGLVKLIILGVNDHLVSKL